MMKLAAFDLEISSTLPDHVSDWSKVAGLGVSCAAVALNDSGAVRLWQGVPKLEKLQCVELTEHLAELVERGYTLVTWNGCSFDFRVLAEESGLVETCGRIALAHVDLMMMVTFTKGWFLSLEAALKGAGLTGKLGRVRLSSGIEIDDMDGSRAPELWAAGEYEAVLDYVEQDAVQLLKLAEFVNDQRRIRWTSRSGNHQEVRFAKLLTAAECFEIPEPDTSWMSDPPSRSQFTDWIRK